MVDVAKVSVWDAAWTSPCNISYNNDDGNNSNNSNDVNYLNTMRKKILI